MGIVTNHGRTKTLPLAAVFFAIAIGLWSFLSGNREISALFSEHYPIQKQVRISLLLSNQTGRDLNSAEVRLYGVVAQTSGQKVVRASIDSPYLQFDDDHKNTVWVFQFSDLARTATKRINAVIDIGFADQAGHPQEDGAERFLRVNTAFVNDPEVRGVLEQVSQANPAESLEKILAWFHKQHANPGLQDIQEKSDVLSVFSKPFSKPYDPSSNESPAIADPVKTVLEVFRSNERTAVGKVFLFTALAQAIDLPSRVVVGLRIDAGQSLTFNDVTAWSEVRMDGQWQHVDIDSGVRVANQPPSYLIMRILDSGMEDIRPEPYEYLVEAMGVQVSPGSVKVRLTKSE